MWSITRLLRTMLSLPIVAMTLGSISIQAQMLDCDLNPGGPAIEDRATVSEAEKDARLGNYAIAALERLQDQIIIYKSLSEFESYGRVARVTFDTFNADLARVTREVEPLLAQLSDRKLCMQLTNALASYRDGAFWWSKLDQTRVVKMRELMFVSQTVPLSESSFSGTVPYTVVIHWRQAHKFLLKAQRLLSSCEGPNYRDSRYQNRDAQRKRVL